MVLLGLQEAEWLYGIPAADALAHPERVLERGSRWQGVLVSGGCGEGLGSWGGQSLSKMLCILKARCK